MTQAKIDVRFTDGDGDGDELVSVDVAGEVAGDRSLLDVSVGEAIDHAFTLIHAAPAFDHIDADEVDREGVTAHVSFENLSR